MHEFNCVSLLGVCALDATEEWANMAPRNTVKATDVDSGRMVSSLFLTGAPPQLAQGALSVRDRYVCDWRQRQSVGTLSDLMRRPPKSTSPISFSRTVGHRKLMRGNPNEKRTTPSFKQ